MKTRIPLLALLLTVLPATCLLAQTPPTKPVDPKAAPITLEEVASFPKQQVTGVTVSGKGRLFVNFPYWSDDHTTSVAEVVNGNPQPYPDEAWNTKTGAPASMWICVQSVVADDAGSLWVLDAASPKMGGVMPGGAKLVQIDLDTNKVVKTFPFDDQIAPHNSYLNDVRIDTRNATAYITESGMGAIIVLNLNTGHARRLLSNHASTRAEPGLTITVDGFKLIDPATGKTPAIHADGIAWDKSKDVLYYHALTGEHLYRVSAAALRDENLSQQDLITRVEDLGKTAKPDGLLEGRDDTVYLTNFEENAIARFDVASGKTTNVLVDERLQWPDTLSWGQDGMLYVATSQIHRMPKYHDGVSKQKGPFKVYRFRLP